MFAQSDPRHEAEDDVRVKVWLVRRRFETVLALPWP